MRLEGKVVMTTGAGSGPGRESSRLFLREGAKVVVTDVSENRAKETTALVHDEGGEAIAVRTDGTAESEVESAVAATVNAIAPTHGMSADFIINAEACAGHGSCYAVASESFEPDDSGYAVATGQIESDRGAWIADVVGTCPEEAITVQDAGGVTR